MEYRTIWISDIHLGTRGCKAEYLLDFLRCNEFDTLYLVGDIIDGWQLSRTLYWPQAHNDIIQKILRKSKKGTRVVYIPGNHDEMLRDYEGLHFGGVEILLEDIYVLADGGRVLVLHGDAFDMIIKNAEWLAHLGDNAYDLALWFNHHFNIFRKMFGMKYWSLSSFLKLRIKRAVQFISSYSDIISKEAHNRGVDFIVCGHIHHAEIKQMDDIVYCNDGDWGRIRTALVEHFDGTLQIIEWGNPPTIKFEYRDGLIK